MLKSGETQARIFFAFNLSWNKRNLYKPNIIKTINGLHISFSGCVLQRIHDNAAAVIQTFNNSDIGECASMCNDELECDQWTQVYGVCFLKTEDSFKHYRKHQEMKWISGIRNCPLNGIYWQNFYFNIFIF